MKFNTYPLLLVIFAVIASANPLNETALNLIKNNDECPITHSGSCCYNHGKGCYPNVAGYAWGFNCDVDHLDPMPVGINCDSTNVPITPAFGVDGDNPGNNVWKWSEPCGGDDGCACCNDNNRGGKYEWANWCEPKWTVHKDNKYCFKYNGCSGDDCCFSNSYAYLCGGSPEGGLINCFCYYNVWESCANSINTYCWAKCGADAPCKNK